MHQHGAEVRSIGSLKASDVEAVREIIEQQTVALIEQLREAFADRRSDRFGIFTERRIAGFPRRPLRCRIGTDVLSRIPIRFPLHFVHELSVYTEKPLEMEGSSYCFKFALSCRWGASP